MSRIHSPQFNHDKERGYLAEDLQLDYSPHIRIIPGSGYIGSPARALAINPNGADDDELEASDAHHTAVMMGMRTAYFLINPQKELITVEEDE